MTTQVHVIPPSLSVSACAMKMRELDVGALPVCHNDRIVGIITDRDLVTQALASGLDARQVPVSELMSTPVVFIHEDEPVSRAAELMEARKIRRLIVLDRNQRLTGILSLSDLATRAGDLGLSGEALEKVCGSGRLSARRVS